MTEWPRKFNVLFFFFFLSEPGCFVVITEKMRALAPEAGPSVKILFIVII